MSYTKNSIKNEADLMNPPCRADLRALQFFIIYVIQSMTGTTFPASNSDA